MTDPDRQRLLAIYLNGHLAGAAAGCRRFDRAGREHAGTPVGPVLTRVGAECRQDRRALLRLMRTAGVRRRPSLLLAARVTEGLSALAPGAREVRRSPVGTVVELEALSLALAGKAAGWVALLSLAAHDGRWPAPELEQLLVRAQDRREALEALRRTVVVEVLGTGP